MYNHYHQYHFWPVFQFVLNVFEMHLAGCKFMLRTEIKPKGSHHRVDPLADMEGLRHIHHFFIRTEIRTTYSSPLLFSHAFHPGTSWYDLRGWLGVKNQLCIYFNSTMSWSEVEEMKQKKWQRWCTCQLKVAEITCVPIESGGDDVRAD